ncbi:MAG: MBL fold metallo-hydrolase, partial [Rhodospirillales bacterium]|nr:MBL fold metallo-hydrolase [Rhodospirillales bacterium]
MTVRLKFHGAARTVTGSCYLVEHPGGRFLVDCGLFQGNKTIRELNYGGFPFDPNVIDFVILTHAHIDHSGLVPKLSRHGFTGPVFTTEGTADLL